MFRSLRCTQKIFRNNPHRFFSTGAKYDVVVIGGGPGGYVAAIKAAQLGLKCAVVEGRGTLGGTCLNVGCIPSKSLLHNSHLFWEAKNEFAGRGIKVTGLELDLPAMLGAKNKSVKGLTAGIEMLMKKNKIDYHKGWGSVTQQNEVSVTASDGNVNKLSTENIIIATGSESSPLRGVEVDEKHIVTSTGALDFDSVPTNMLVVGGGVIGLELGSVWSRLGSEVEVVEFMDQILVGMDDEIVKESTKILKKQGLKFTLSTGVKAARVEGNQVSVDIESRDGTKKETKIYDKVLVAVGRRPYTENLFGAGVNVEMDGPRVNIDDHWRTNYPNIYAIGDVVKGAMLAHKAEEEGIAVAEQIAGKHGHVNYNAIPGVIYTFPEIASVGYTEQELKQKGIKYNKGKFTMGANSRAKTVDQTYGFVKVLSDAETDRMLGVHIIAPNAGEMIAEGVIGIEYGASSEDLARTCHAHPTMSEAFKEACMATYDKPIHS